MSHLELSLLGPFEATLDGEPVTGFESNKARALLAYLSVEAGTPHSRGTLAGMLWPDWPEPSARRNLSNALSNLRSAIAERDASPRHVVVTREAIQFNRASDYTLDVETFTEMAQLAPSDPCPASRLEGAAALYGGEFLEGLSVADSPAFEDWALLVRQRLHQQALGVLDRLAADCAREGRYEQACQYARREVELEPSEESAHARLMRLYAWSGQRAAAIRQYRECVRILEEELGVPPARETVELCERIAEDREQPPWAGQLATESALRAPPTRHNLPAQLIPLVGRSKELDEIVAWLRDPACRLLTLVGPGGSGKTRLAIEAARRIAEGAPTEGYPDGAHLVSLAPLGSPDRLAATIAQAIGLSPVEETEPREQLIDYLQRRRVLLVLDNLEHLLEGMGLVAEVLRRAPQVAVLATSRARLNVPGEQLYLVHAMSVPPSPLRQDSSPGDLLRHSAVRLFLEGARRVCPDYRPGADDLRHIAQVCRLARGMPLAILLAAAWVPALSAEEIALGIAGHLGSGVDFLAADWHGVPERQRSVRAVFDHSWGLLTAQEREALAGLAVFRGPFTRQAAGEVAGAGPRELLGLVGKSLLERTPSGRYGMHELLRQYATEKLAASTEGVEGACDRHAAHYAAAMEGWAVEFQGTGQLVAMGELEAEIADVRAAWAWMVERGRAEWLGRALDVVYMHFTWDARRSGEVDTMYRLAAERLSSAAKSPAPAEVLRVLSRLLAARCLRLAWPPWTRGDHRLRLARDLAERSLGLLERPELAGQDVRRERAFAMVHRAIAGHDLDYAEVARLLDSAAALFRALGERWWEAYTLDRWGWLASVLHGQLDEGGRRFGESAALYRELGNLSGLTSALAGVAESRTAQGRFGEAEGLWRENLALRYRLAEDGSWLGMGQVNLATNLYYLGRYAEARAVTEEGIAICDRLVQRWTGIRHTANWVRIQAALGQYTEARQRGQVLLETCRTGDEPFLIGLALYCLGCIDVALEAYGEAWERAEEAVSQWGRGGYHWKSWPSGVLGHAARGLGQGDRAHRFFVQALGEAAGWARVPFLLDAIPGVALLLSDQGQTERAVELYALCCRYPLVANSRWFEDVVGRHIASAAEGLPEDVVAAAQERGRSADLWATVHALLAELGSQHVEA